jgi:hypothetical protein
VSDPTITQLEKQIERLQKTLADAQAVMDAPWQTVGAFETGRSRRSPALERRHQAAVDRRMNAFRTAADAKAKLEAAERRLRQYVAGEVHANGQPRADAPSKVKAADRQALRSEYKKTLITKGGMVGLGFDSDRTMRVKRVNAKTITTELGVTWEYSEIVPVIDGERTMTLDAFKAGFAAWLESEGA